MRLDLKSLKIAKSSSNIQYKKITKTNQILVNYLLIGRNGEISKPHSEYSLKGAVDENLTIQGFKPSKFGVNVGESQ